MRTLSVLTALILCASGAVGAVDPAPPSRAIEAPSQQFEAPQQPWIEHVGGSAPAAEAAAMMTVDPRTIAPASADELARMRMRPRSHIQGKAPLPLGPLTLSQPFDGSPPSFDQSFPNLPRIGEAPAAQGELLTNFAGIGNTGWIPPDTVVAVGPEHVLAATNSGYALYSKTGRQIRGYTTMDAFFSGLRPAGWAANGGFMFDPKVYYDWYHQKFVMFTLARADVTETSHFFIAISKTSDATRGWWAWRYDWPEAGTWVDYSSISADQWGLYVTGDVFFFGGGFRYVHLLTLNPAMFNGGTSNGWRFWDLRWPVAGDPTIFDLQAARPQSTAADAASFFVNSSSGSYNKMGLWKLTGDRTSSPILTRALIATGTYYPVYINVRQPDTITRIDGFSNQLVEAAYSNRRVWATMTSGENSGTPTWGGIYTARINVDSNAMDWESLIWSANQYYTFPAVTVAPGAISASSPNVVLFGTWTAPDRYASTIFYLSDPDADDSFFATRLGTARYVALDDSGRNRWGDYSGAAYDWTCNTVWGAAEFASAINTWGTQISEVDFTGTGRCPRIDVTIPADTSTWYAGNPASVQWSRSSLTASNQIYIYYYENDAYVAQIGGPFSPTATAASVTMPWRASALGQMFVGSWNAGAGAWEMTDLSDAYFTVAAAPDLRVTPFTTPVSYVVVSTNLQMDAVVGNSGNGSSAASTLRFYRSVDNVISAADTLLATSAIGSLAAGGSTARQLITSNTGSVGTWYFGACVDVVSNDPAGNNCTSSPVAISVRTQNMFANGFE